MIGFHEGATQFSLLPSSVFQIFFLLFDRVFFYPCRGALMGFFESASPNAFGCSGIASPTSAARIQFFPTATAVTTGLHLD
jgi:hypothetical protein